MLKSILPICAALLLLCACATELSPQPQVTVSIEPLRYFVTAIAGDKVDVNTLVPAGSSPETYELTPQQVVDVSRSRAYFSIGTLGFEKTRLQQLTDNNPSLLTVNVSDSITLLPASDNCVHLHATHRPHTEGIDLHTWTSPASGRKIAQKVCATLSQIDTANTHFYNQRCDSLLQHINALDAQIKTLLAPLPHRTFLIYHPALGYFARDYGLSQLAVEADGKEPSAERMQQLIRQAQAERVNIVFIQAEHAGRAAQRVAEAIGAKVVPIAPLSYDWDEQLLHIARALATSSAPH